MSADTAMSFDRMRGMLNRAAEIRESEQQQVFDSLDEIHARLAALDALGTMRKRLSELPDRTEVSVLAERLDETVAKLDAQDAAIAAIMRAVEAIPDKLAKPFAQLDGRLDGMAGRMEGISGRMDGLDDRLGGLHKRIDELDHRLDRHEMRLDAMPTSVGTPIREKIDAVERVVREQLDASTRAMDESAEGVRNLLGDTSIGLHRRLEDLAGRPAIDPTEPLASITQRLEALATRLDTLDEGMSGRLGTLGGSHSASEQRNAGQLDEAMATFAEIILGRGSSVQNTPPPPRPTQRRTPRVKVKSPNGSSAAHTELVGDDPDE
jgi:hypothetical protein